MDGTGGGNPPLEIGHIRVSAQPGDIVKPLGCRASPKPGAVSLRSHLRAPMPRSLRYSAWVYPASDEQRFGRAADSADPRSKGEWTFFSIRAGADRRQCAETRKPGWKPTSAGCRWLPEIEGDGLGVPDLALRDADQGLFIAMVALDLPAIHVGLQQRLQIQFRSGADEKSGLAVEQLGAFAQPVTQRFDDQQQQR